MKFKLIAIGKTSSAYLEEGISVYLKRLIHYTAFTIEIVADVKSAGTLDQTRLKELEAVNILKKINDRDLVVLLDENGKHLTSEGFANQISKWMLSGDRNVVFVIGGAFGFGDELKKRANYSMSLSSMTFSHQMARLIFTEQLYRAFTIIKGEQYHHK